MKEKKKRCSEEIIEEQVCECNFGFWLVLKAIYSHPFISPQMATLE